MKAISYILGLDVGVTSLGWCILKCDTDNRILGIEKLGVRIFPDGRDAQTKEPLAVARRNARSIRKNTDRKTLRMNTLRQFLIENNLLPQDKEKIKEVEKLNPYELRDKAARQEVSAFELSRALYHICMRRGFQSNRKSDKKNTDTGAIKTAIEELEEKLSTQTLGQYLYSLYKQDNHTQLRINSRKIGTKNVYNFYTSRDMYKYEVDVILSHQNFLSEEQKEKIKEIIFFQRPLQKQEVGFCFFEENEHRTAKASPLFQAFRVQQLVNNLEYRAFETGECLTDENRQIIKEMLSKSKEVSFDSIRKKLNVDYPFNYEDEKTKKLKGNETNAILSRKDAFGKDWFNYSPKLQEQIVQILIEAENDNKVEEFLKENCPSLTPEQRQYIIDVTLPDGYGQLSSKALSKLLPLMEDGLNYYEACDKLGYHEAEKTKCDTLPYYGQLLYKKLLGGSFDVKDKDFPELYYGKINNPTVHIGLNQIRKVVNEIIKTYGKPKEIVVELARDLKMTQKERSEKIKEQSANQKENERINKILEEMGVSPNYDSRMQYKLWEDLNEDPFKRCCPFCGKQISATKIFSAEFEIEHLLPFSRSFDDSRNNKVLACKSCNNEKLNQTPWEAFHIHQNPKYDWNEITARAEAMPKKAWRFSQKATESIEENTVLARFLNDTRYLAKVTKEYLECLTDVRTIPGQLTAKMRKIWQFNSLFGEDEEKDRTDHRHHAIDALTVACTNRSTLQTFSSHSKESYERKRKILSGSLLPFLNFDFTALKKMFDEMVISYKPDHKDVQRAVKKGATTGALHEESNFGLVQHLNDDGSFSKRYAIRKPLIDLVEDKKIAEIGDRKIRKELQTLLAGKTKDERKELLNEYSQEHNISTIRVHINKSDNSMIALKKKEELTPYRYVNSGSNYCIDIYCPNRGKNNGKWCGEIIRTFDAHQKGFISNWRKTEPEAKLVMRLFINDMVAYEENGQRIICRVQKMSKGCVYLTPHTIAKTEKEPPSFSPAQLQKKNARHIKVDVLGNVLDVKDNK